MSRRHLSAAEAAAVLRRGRQVEQLLGVGLVEGRPAVRWLTVGLEGRRYRVVRHEVEDVGNDEYLDVSTFPPLDEDEYAGEGLHLGDADSPQHALDLAESFGAVSDRWVNEGIVQDEYADARSPR